MSGSFNIMLPYLSCLSAECEKNWKTLFSDVLEVGQGFTLIHNEPTFNLHPSMLFQPIRISWRCKHQQLAIYNPISTIFTITLDFCNCCVSRLMKAAYIWRENRETLKRMYYQKMARLHGVTTLIGPIRRAILAILHPIAWADSNSILCDHVSVQSIYSLWSNLTNQFVSGLTSAILFLKKQWTQWRRVVWTRREDKQHDRRTDVVTQTHMNGITDVALVRSVQLDMYVRTVVRLSDGHLNASERKRVTWNHRK